MARDSESSAKPEVGLADVLDELEAFHELTYDGMLRIERSVESIRQSVIAIALLLFVFALVGGGLALVVVVNGGS